MFVLISSSATQPSNPQPPEFFLKKANGTDAEMITVGAGMTAKTTKHLERLADAKAQRSAAGKKSFNEQIRLMRNLGILPPGMKPKTKHFNLLAAHYNGAAAAARAVSAQRDLAAFEQAGGAGAVIMAILNNPNAKATERAIALQAMGQMIKAAPQVVAAIPVGDKDSDSYLIDDSELTEIEKEFGDDE